MASPGYSSGMTSVQKNLYISETTSDSEAVLSDSEDEYVPYTYEEESSEKELSGVLITFYLILWHSTVLLKYLPN